jgi:hypothetical protein
MSSTGPIRRFFVEHPAVVLIALGGLMAASFLGYMLQLSVRLDEVAAMQGARTLSESLTQFRTVYTRDVVERVRAQGVEVTHDYRAKDKAIPLPATLSLELAAGIGAQRSGAKAYLYSPYPFPWRQATGGLRDEFAKSAWEAFRSDPSEPFYRTEEVDGERRLRYATADLMRESCVDCHNHHAQTPKDDWAVGDVRGVLEVTLPLEGVESETRRAMAGALGLVLLAGLLAVAVVVIAVRAARGSAQS